MKIKAKDAGIVRITPGKEYFVYHEFCLPTPQYIIKDDKGNYTTISKQWFFEPTGLRVTLNEEGQAIVTNIYSKAEEQEPEITVGSEWVDEQDTEFVVLFVSNKNVVIKGKRNEFEALWSKESFKDCHSTKPKTVTMYFHKIGQQIYAYDVEQTCRQSFLFTKEIEL